MCIRDSPMAEHAIPNGRPLGLEVIPLSGDERAILAVNEFHMGLYSADGGRRIWDARFDTPAAAYAVVARDGRPFVYVAKSDGMILAFDMRGKAVRRGLLEPQLTGIAPIRFGRDLHLVVSSDEGIALLTPELRPEDRLPFGASTVAPLDEGKVLAACDGKVVALTVHGRGPR